MNLEQIADNDELLKIGRKAIEDALVEFRDNRLSEFGRGNGLVIKEKDGTDSYIIRFGPETALRIGLKAIHKHLKEKFCSHGINFNTRCYDCIKERGGMKPLPPPARS